jgi:hypothetical protein
MASRGVRLAAAFAACLVLWVGPVAPAHARPTTCGAWELVDSPNVGSRANELDGVSAASARDVWAVGNSYTGSVFKTLVEHYDGTGWTVVSSPNVGSRTNSLNAVAAVSAGEAWAVGHYDDGTTFRTLVERWDGTSWKVVISPNSGTGENVLRSVAAVGPDDVWAVGYHEPAAGAARQTLALHWDGTSWQVVSTPSVGSEDNYLWSVTARANGEVWAVGAYSIPWFQTLTERWDGASWTVVPSPSFGDGNNALYAAAVLRNGRVIAVGDRLSGFGTKTLAEHWDGSKWSGHRTPSPAGYLNELFGVADANSHDVWAVGYSEDSIGDLIETLAIHWDGSAWTQEATPNPGPTGNIFAAVARVPHKSEFWAVGHWAEVQNQTLIEHRC